MLTKNRQTGKREKSVKSLDDEQIAARKRFREVYDEWRESQNKKGESVSMEKFGEIIECAHSTLSDLLTEVPRRDAAKRDIPTKVVRACYRHWNISPSWLLFGDGPRFAFEITANDLESQLAKRLDAAIKAADSDNLPLLNNSRDVIAEGLEPDIDVSVSPVIRVNATNAIAALCRQAVAEAEAIAEWRLMWNTLSAITIERMRDSQYATVHGQKSVRRSVLHAPWIKRATAKMPPQPKTEIVEAI